MASYCAPPIAGETIFKNIMNVKQHVESDLSGKDKVAAAVSPTGLLQRSRPLSQLTKTKCPHVKNTHSAMANYRVVLSKGESELTLGETIPKSMKRDAMNTEGNLSVKDEVVTVVIAKCATTTDTMNVKSTFVGKDETVAAEITKR